LNEYSNCVYLQINN